MYRSSQHSDPTTQSLDLGRKGEEIAAAYLQQLGFQIVVANVSVPVGRNRNEAIVNAEIDLVVYEGPVLCFVEVKTRASDWFAPPTANVDLRKQRQIIRAARVYRRMFGLTDEQYRYDVVSIVLSRPTTDQAESPDAVSTTESASRRSSYCAAIGQRRSFGGSANINPTGTDSPSPSISQNNRNFAPLPALTMTRMRFRSAVITLKMPAISTKEELRDGILDATGETPCPAMATEDDGGRHCPRGRSGQRNDLPPLQLVRKKSSCRMLIGLSNE
jgi:putative endonuclease